MPWPRDFPASREFVHFHPYKNFDIRNFRGAPAKRNSELSHPHPAPPAHIEFDTLRSAQIAKLRARDFPVAPASLEMIRLAARRNKKSTPHAVHSTRSQLALPPRAPHRYAATASRTKEIPTIRSQRFPAEFPSELISSASTSAPMAWQAGPTRKDPLRSAGRFPSKYLFQCHNKGKRT